MLVNRDKSIIDDVLCCTPNGSKYKPLIADSLAAVFVQTVGGPILQAIFTYIIFDFMKMEYKYVICLLVMFFKVVPLFPNYLFGIIGAVITF